MSLMQILDLVIGLAVLMWLVAAILVGPRWLSSPMLWFCLGSIVFLQVGALRDYWVGVTYSSELELRFRWLEMVHVAIVYAGYKTGQKMRGRSPSKLAQVKVSLRWFLVAALGANALKALVANPFDRFDAEADVSNYARMLLMLSYAAASVAIGIYHQSVRPKRGAAYWLGVGALALAFLPSAFSQSRTPVMYSLFVLLMYVTWRCQLSRTGTALTRIGIVYVLPLGVVGLLAVGSLLKGYAAVTTAGADAETMVKEAESHGSTLAFIDAYENGMFVLDSYPSPFKYRYGESIGALILGPIPRSLWPEKPMGFSHYMTYAKVGTTRQAAGLSLATSLVGDLWGGGGWPNVVGLSLALGLALGLAQRWYDDNHNAIMVKIVYWQVLFMAFLAQRGDIYTIFHRAMLLIAFTVILLRLLGSRGAALAGTVSPTSRELR